MYTEQTSLTLTNTKSKIPLTPHPLASVRRVYNHRRFFGRLPSYTPGTAGG
jgi:hypothetical protein